MPPHDYGKTFNMSHMSHPVFAGSVCFCARNDAESLSISQKILYVTSSCCFFADLTLSHVHKDAELPFDFCITFNGSAFSVSSGYVGFSAAKILGKPMSIIVAWPLPWSWMISCGSLGILRVIQCPNLSNISLISWTQFGLRALGFRFGAASFQDCSLDVFSTTLTAVPHGSRIYMLVI